MAKSNLDNLSKFAARMTQEVLTEEDFLKAFKSVVDIIKKREADFIKTSGILKDSIETLKDKLQKDNSVSMSDIKGEVERLFVKLHKDAVNDLNFVKDTARRIKDGKDADEEKIVKTVLAQMPQMDEFKHPDAIKHRDELEALEGDDALKLKSVVTLGERMKLLEERPLGSRGGSYSDSSCGKCFNLSVD